MAAKKDTWETFAKQVCMLNMFFSLQGVYLHLFQMVAFGKRKVAKHEYVKAHFQPNNICLFS